MNDELKKETITILEKALKERDDEVIAFTQKLVDIYLAEPHKPQKMAKAISSSLDKSKGGSNSLTAEIDGKQIYYRGKCLWVVNSKINYKGKLGEFKNNIGLITKKDYRNYIKIDVESLRKQNKLFKCGLAEPSFYLSENTWTDDLDQLQDMCDVFGSECYATEDFSLLEFTNGDESAYLGLYVKK